MKHNSFSTFLRKIHAFFALNIVKGHIKKNHGKKIILTFHFLEKNTFYLNQVDIHVIYVKKFLTKMDI